MEKQEAINQGLELVNRSTQKKFKGMCVLCGL